MPSSCSRVAPLLLRLALGATFLWAGLGKFMATMPVQGDAAATLANMGSLTPAPGVATPPHVQPPAPTPSNAVPGRPVPSEPLPSGTPPAAPGGHPPPLVAFQAAAQTRVYTAADFPEPVQVARMYGIALMLHDLALPGARPDGGTSPRMWPSQLGEGRWPVVFAWIASLSELIGGVFLLLGLLTRVSALFTGMTMLGAIYFAQVAPAVRSGNTRLGFLPRYDWFAGPGGYEMVFFPLCLAAGAFALLLLGGGALSADDLFLRRTPPPPPRPAAPKPPAA